MQIITPDLKGPSIGKEGVLVFVDLSAGKSRIGGTALAQVFKQIGDTCPDFEDATTFKKAFNVTQDLIEGKKTRTHLTNISPSLNQLSF